MFLPPEDRESGFTRHDLSEVELNEALDDARSLSLFASNRIIWMASAEAALPRGRAISASDDDEDAPAGAPALIKAYVNDPSPSTVVVFDSSRYELDGDDKAKTDRLLKFYKDVPAQIEFKPYLVEDARFLAQSLAKQAGLQLGTAETGILVEALAGDASRWRSRS
jgi:DNA polymerase-3 subunit delta